MEQDRKKFKSFVPRQDVDLGIYKDALDYAIKNDEIKNIGIIGPYGAGKSSIIETYKVQNPKNSNDNTQNELKFLHISLANFKEAKKTVKRDGIRKITAKVEGQGKRRKENELEGQIINQLFYQIDEQHVPQLSLRRKNISENEVEYKATSYIVLTVFALYLIGFFTGFQSFGWRQELIDFLCSPITFALVLVTMMSIIGVKLCDSIRNNRYQGIIKKISFGGNELELFSTNDDSYFDKYLDEVLYLFENCGADVIVFEDIDRYEEIEVFKRLREMNFLVNKNRNGKPLKFMYLVRDDLFDSKDRTKFFDFIIPVIPVVSGANAFELMKKEFQERDVNKGEIPSDDLLRSIGVYVDDMRIIMNAVNEYIIYSSKLPNQLKDPDKQFAMILYKNLFPKDFSDLQLRKGFVYEVLTGGKAKSVDGAGDPIIDWNGRNVCELEEEEFDKYYKHISTASQEAKNNGKDALTIKNVIESNYAGIIRYFIFNGYLNENYDNYINYFYPYDVNEGDKKFINAVKEGKELEADYELESPRKILKNLGDKDFKRRAALNYDMTAYVLRDIENNKDKINSIVKQIKGGNRLDFIFGYINKFLDRTDHIGNLVREINSSWPEFFSILEKSGEYETDFKKTYAQLSLMYSDEDTLEIMNEDGYLKEFIDFCGDFLDLSLLERFHSSSFSNLFAGMVHLKVQFQKLELEKANKELWQKVYKNDMYLLDLGPIKQILKYQYGLDKIEDFESRNLSLILSKPEAPLAKYVEEKIDEYMGDYLEECGESICDDESVVLFVLNNDDIDDARKNLYIERLTTQITCLEDVKDESLWTKLLEKDLVAFSSDNFFDYFFKMNEVIDEALVKYLNDSTEELDFNYNSINKKYGEGKGETIYGCIVKCEGIKNDKYKEILKKANRPYNEFPNENLSKGKIDILISLGVIEITKDNLAFLRDNYEDNIETFILKNPKKYVDIITKDNFNVEEAVTMLKQSERTVGWSTKRKLLKKTEKSIPFSLAYQDSIQKHILEYNFDITELCYVLKNYDNLSINVKEALRKIVEQKVQYIYEEKIGVPRELLLEIMEKSAISNEGKKELFAVSIELLTKEDCKKCCTSIDEMGLKQYLENGAPALEDNVLNKMILEAFRKRKWVSQYWRRNSKLFAKRLGK